LQIAPTAERKNPHANMGQPLFTAHCSLTPVHRSLTSDLCSLLTDLESLIINH